MTSTGTFAAGIGQNRHTGGLPVWPKSFSKHADAEDAGMLAEFSTISFGKDTKGKQRLIITDLEGAALAGI